MGLDGMLTHKLIYRKPNGKCWELFMTSIHMPGICMSIMANGWPSLYHYQFKYTDTQILVWRKPYSKKDVRELKESRSIMKEHT